ncbi:MAG: GAF domain-containing protein, partial [Chloroflexi bacterium]|nr:GAF domain-containing protein [Chloroflexota bacterium]
MSRFTSPLVLLVTEPDHSSRSPIRVQLEGSGITVRDLSDSGGAIRSAWEDDPIAAMIAAEPGRHLQLAYQIRQSARDLHLIFLASPGQEGLLRRSLLFDPLIGNSWSIISLQSAHRLGEQTSEILKRLQQRRAHESALSEINTQIARFERPGLPERLALVESQLASLLTYTDQAIFSTDLVGVIDTWNHASERLFGRTAGAIIGTTIDTLLPLQDSAGETAVLEELRAGIPHVLEIRWPPETDLHGTHLHETDLPETRPLHLDENAPGESALDRTRPERGTSSPGDAPSSRHLEIKLAPIRRMDSRVAGILALCTDITQRRLAEQRQRVQTVVNELLVREPSPDEAWAALLPALAESLHCQRAEFWQVDSSTPCLRCTRTWHSSPPRELASSPCEPIFRPGEGLPGMAWQTGSAVWVVDVVGNECFRRKDEAAQDGLRTAIAFPVLSGTETIGILLLLARETQQRDAELLQVVVSIGQQVGQYIVRKRAEAERDRLIEDLAATDRRKNEFLAMLAHELRNPLAAIRNGAHLLNWLIGADPALRRVQGLLERQVGHLARMVDDLLDVARITRGHIDIRRVELNLADVVTEAIEVCRDLIDSRGHVLSVQMPSESVQLLG